MKKLVFSILLALVVVGAGAYFLLFRAGPELAPPVSQVPVSGVEKIVIFAKVPPELEAKIAKEKNPRDIVLMFNRKNTRFRLNADRVTYGSGGAVVEATLSSAQKQSFDNVRLIWSFHGDDGGFLTQIAPLKDAQDANSDRRPYVIHMRPQLKTCSTNPSSTNVEINVPAAVRRSIDANKDFALSMFHVVEPSKSINVPAAFYHLAGTRISGASLQKGKVSVQLPLPQNFKELTAGPDSMVLFFLAQCGASEAIVNCINPLSDYESSFYWALVPKGHVAPHSFCDTSEVHKFLALPSGADFVNIVPAELQKL